MGWAQLLFPACFYCWEVFIWDGEVVFIRFPGNNYGTGCSVFNDSMMNSVMRVREEFPWSEQQGLQESVSLGCVIHDDECFGLFFIVFISKSNQVGFTVVDG